jgi:pimeloyl-ACP methyl ester carboxylesterase
MPHRFSLALLENIFKHRLLKNFGIATSEYLTFYFLSRSERVIPKQDFDDDLGDASSGCGRMNAMTPFLRLVVWLGVPVLFLPGCSNSALRYREGEAERFAARRDTRVILYETDSDPRRSYYLSGGDAASPPKTLLIAFPGIGTRALDLLDLFEGLPPGTGVLLLEYPGRGENGGTMRPGRLAGETAKAVEALARAVGVPEDGAALDLRLFGHSFGTAAALDFARKDRRVSRIVLAAPMIDVYTALRGKIGFWAWFLPASDRLDNAAALRGLGSMPRRPMIAIIHGEKDESIPVADGRALAALGEGWIEYREVPGAGHTDVLDREREFIREKLLAALPE